MLMNLPKVIGISFFQVLRFNYQLRKFQKSNIDPDFELKQFNEGALKV